MFNPKGSFLDEQLATSGIENEILGTIKDIFTGGGYSRNKQAKSATKKQNKYQKKVWKFNWQEQKRQYKYNVEGLKIQKENDEKNLQFQEANLVQQWNYNMGVRQFEHEQNTRLYDRSVAFAVQQQEYNQMAEKFALVDQDRLLHEQLIDLAFDRTETLLEYRHAAAGLGLKQRQTRGAAATEAQATRISGLKAQGASGARGAGGRSAAKDIQGIVAETGARQTAIVDEMMYGLEGVATDFTKLNNQFIIDQVALDFSEDSAKLSDTSARNKIKAQSLQAAIDAQASIALRPEIAPPLPKPYALPRPEYQDVYKPEKPPKPMKNVAMQENLWAAGISTAANIAASAATAGLAGTGFGTTAFKGFNWGQAALGAGGVSFST